MQVGIGPISSKHTTDPAVLAGSRGWTRLRMRTSYLVVASCQYTYSSSDKLEEGVLTSSTCAKI
jgi:hypothetical protein